MSPPMRGQNTPVTYPTIAWGDSGVQRHLLLRRGKGPRHLEAALLPKYEPQLARRTQPVWMIGAIGGAWSGLR